jgi:hypothetical protein
MPPEGPTPPRQFVVADFQRGHFVHGSVIYLSLLTQVVQEALLGLFERNDTIPFHEGFVLLRLRASGQLYLSDF